MRQNALWRRAMVTSLVAWSVPQAVLAQDEASYTKETWPTELIRRPLTLASGMVEIALPVNFNLSNNTRVKPIYINPSISYGFTDKFTLGIVHTIGLCINGEHNGCPSVYHDVGLAGLYEVVSSNQWRLALAAGVNLARISPSPLLFNAEAGFSVRGQFAPVAVRFQPRIVLGLNERDSKNLDLLELPLDFEFQVTPQVALFILTGLFGPLNPPFNDFTDYFFIPVGAGGLFAINNHVDIGAQFVFDNLLGKRASADFRTLTVFGAFRF